MGCCFSKSDPSILLTEQNSTALKDNDVSNERNGNRKLFVFI